MAAYLEFNATIIQKNENVSNWFTFKDAELIDSAIPRSFNGISILNTINIIN